MAQVINTNIASLNAQRNLNSSQAGTNQALERLSSGLRINSAADDAAGLAISTRFQSQINGLNVAIRNAGDGVSLAQTAEGALGSMTDGLQRIRELAVQSANATNSSVDREALQDEVSQLLAEISRNGEQTKFNGINLLDGSFSTQLQVGANTGESISFGIGELTADSIGSATTSGVSAVGTSSALANGDLTINGVSIGASRASDDTASTASAGSSAIAKAAAINRADAGVTALVDENVVGGSAMTAAAATGSVTINGTSIAIDTTGDAATTRAAVAAAINAESELTGVTAIDTGDDSLGVTLVAEDGRNIVTAFDTVTAESTGLGAAGTHTGGYTLVADGDVNEITITGGDGTGTGDLANSGLAVGVYSAGTASVTSTSQQGVASVDAVAATMTPGGAPTLPGADFSTNSFSFDVVVSNSADPNDDGTHTVLFEANAAGDLATVLADINDDLGAAVEAFDDGGAVGFRLATAGAGDISINSFDGNAAGGGIVVGTANDVLGFDVEGSTFTTVGGVDGTTGADTVAAAFDDLNAGDLTINGVGISAANAGDDTASYAGADSSSKAASGISIAAAINEASDSTGVTAQINATQATGTAATTAGDSGDSGALFLNGVEISLTSQGDADANRTFAVSQINSVSGQTGVTAEDNGTSLTLTAADGRNIVMALDTNAASTTGITAANFGLGGAGISETDITTDNAGGGAGTAAQRLAEADGQATTTYSTVTLQSAGEIEVTGGINGNSGLEGLGLEQGTFGGGTEGQFIKDLDISTLEGANAALTSIDNALQSISSERSKLGAIQNRLESTISNLTVTSENLSAANSRILDADFAAETAALSRSQILQQAGVSILSQANAAPQQVLSLLQ